MPIVNRVGNFDHIDWKIPIEHFLWDRLAEAHDEASQLSVGVGGQYLSWYRMIEAEWLTRQSAEREQVNEWLTVEWIPDETEDASELPSNIQSICEATGRAFQVEERPEILVSVLSAESDAPWVDARAGYFIDKYPFDKICIPQRSLSDPRHLTEVVSHEYVHALNLTLTEGKCPLWLNEGMAMLSQQVLDTRSQRDFASGRAPWKDPRKLDGAFHAELQGDRDYNTIHRAYEQAALIVRYLVNLGDIPKLGQLMRAFTDNSILGELKIRLLDEDPADEALLQIYDLSLERVFDQALEWVKSRT